MSVGAIDTSRIEAMMAQLKAAAARANPANENPLAVKQAPEAPSFQTVLKSSLDQVNSMQNQSRDMAQRFESGDTTVSLSDAMISLQKSSIAFQQTVQVRNKLVEAYQNIMNMNV